MFLFEPNSVQIYRASTAHGLLEPRDIDRFVKHVEETIPAQEGIVDPRGAEVAAHRSCKVHWLKSDASPTIHSWTRAVAQAVLKINREIYRFEITGVLEAMQYTVYDGERNDQYNWHVDVYCGSHTEPPVQTASDAKPAFDASRGRKLSATVLLSDPSEFEGGDLEIRPDLIQTTSVELRKGSLVCFPSFMPHRVTPVTRGIRRSLVFWVAGPQFH